MQAAAASSAHLAEDTADSADTGARRGARTWRRARDERPTAAAHDAARPSDDQLALTQREVTTKLYPMILVARWEEA